MSGAVAIAFDSATGGFPVRLSLSRTGIGAVPVMRVAFARHGRQRLQRKKRRREIDQRFGCKTGHAKYEQPTAQLKDSVGKRTHRPLSAVTVPDLKRKYLGWGSRFSRYEYGIIFTSAGLYVKANTGH